MIYYIMDCACCLVYDLFGGFKRYLKHGGGRAGQHKRLNDFSSGCVCRWWLELIGNIVVNWISLTALLHLRE